MRGAATFTFAAPITLASGRVVAGLRLREPTVREFLDLGPLALRPARRGFGTCAVDVPGRPLDYLRRVALDLAPDEVDEIVAALPLAEAIRLKAALGSIIFDAPRGQVEDVADALALDWAQGSLLDLDRLPLSALSELSRRVRNHATRLKKRGA